MLKFYYRAGPVVHFQLVYIPPKVDVENLLRVNAVRQKTPHKA